MSRTFKDKPYSVIEENARSCGFSHTRTFGWGYSFEEIDVNYRDDERRGLDVGVTPATLVREVVAGTPSIMGG